jgi:3-deoxy-D-manno-octulosonic-acid transferase
MSPQESPFLPQLVLQAAARGVKLALINGRMDPGALLAWHSRLPARRQLSSVLQCYTLIVPQSDVVSTVSSGAG